MSLIIFRPFSQWPAKLTRSRQSWPGDSGYNSTIELLLKELDTIHARNRVIQLDLGKSYIRNDGFPRADARPSHPGVIVTFDIPRTDGPGTLPQIYARDTYFEWQYNLRAIALTLEKLRAVARYSGGQQQYEGFKALPAPTGTTLATHHTVNPPSAKHAIPNGPFTDKTSAARYIVNWADEGNPEHVISAPGERDRLIKLAKSRAHPDAVNGSEDAFLRLSEAIEYIKT